MATNIKNLKVELHKNGIRIIDTQKEILDDELLTIQHQSKDGKWTSRNIPFDPEGFSILRIGKRSMFVYTWDRPTRVVIQRRSDVLKAKYKHETITDWYEDSNLLMYPNPFNPCAYGEDQVLWGTDNLKFLFGNLLFQDEPVNAMAGTDVLVQDGSSKKIEDLMGEDSHSTVVKEDLLADVPYFTQPSTEFEAREPQNEPQAEPTATEPSGISEPAFDQQIVMDAPANTTVTETGWSETETPETPAGSEPNAY